MTLFLWIYLIHFILGFCCSLWFITQMGNKHHPPLSSWECIKISLTSEDWWIDLVIAIACGLLLFIPLIIFFVYGYILLWYKDRRRS